MSDNSPLQALNPYAAPFSYKTLTQFALLFLVVGFITVFVDSIVANFGRPQSATTIIRPLSGVLAVAFVAILLIWRRPSNWRELALAAILVSALFTKLLGPLLALSFVLLLLRCVLNIIVKSVSYYSRK